MPRGIFYLSVKEYLHPYVIASEAKQSRSEVVKSVIDWIAAVAVLPRNDGRALVDFV